MRKFMFATLGGASILAAATPAVAQYYPQSYGYNAPVRGRMVTVWGAFERRLENVRRELGGVRPDRAYRLAAEADRLDRQLRFAARNNADAYLVRDLDARIGQLERRVGASRGGGYSWYNSNDRNEGDQGWHGYSDHDRDGPGEEQ